MQGKEVKHDVEEPKSYSKSKVSKNTEKDKVYLKVYREEGKGWFYELTLASGTLIKGSFDVWEAGVVQVAHCIFDLYKKGELDTANMKFEPVGKDALLFSYAVTGYLLGLYFAMEQFLK